VRYLTAASIFAVPISPAGGPFPLLVRPSRGRMHGRKEKRKAANIIVSVLGTILLRTIGDNHSESQGGDL